MALSFGSPTPVASQGTAANYQTNGVLPAAATVAGGLYGLLNSGSNSPPQYQSNSTMPSWMQGQYQNAIGYTDAAAARNSGQAIAGLTPDQLQAMQYIRNSVGFGQPQLTAAQNQAQAIAQGGITPQAIQSYMNPYTQSVVNASLNTLNQQQGITDAGIASQAKAANAFGGDRAVVAQNLSDNSYNQQKAAMIAGLNSQGYQQAANTAGQSVGLQLQGNAQLQNAINNRVNTYAGQVQNLLNSGNQQQAQNQGVNNWAIQQAQIAQSILNPNVNPSFQSGSVINPISGAISGLQSGLQLGNGLSSLYSSIFGNGGGSQGSAYGGAAGSYGGSDPYSTGTDYSGYTPPTDYSSPYSDEYAAPGLDMYQTGQVDDLSNLSFNAAGGEAANGMTASNPQSQNNAAVAGWSSDAGQALNAGKLGAGFAGNTDLSNLAGLGSSALGIYSGLQRGGVSGYGGAALSGASAANQASKALTGSGLYSPTEAAGIGGAGNALAIYNGIKQGGVQGYGTAALNAAQLYGNASALDAAAGGSGFAGAGAASTIGAYALPVAAFAALNNYAEKQLAPNPEEEARTDQRNATGSAEMAQRLSDPNSGYVVGNSPIAGMDLSGLANNAAMGQQWWNGLAQLTLQNPQAVGQMFKVSRGSGPVSLTSTAYRNQD